MLNYKNNNLVDVKKITLFSVFLFVLSSCANKIPLNSFEQEVPKIAPIYSNIDHWAAHPEKSDYLDLRPKNLLNDTLSLESVDVFYVYPTLYFDGFDWNADFNNKKLSKKIKDLALKNQVSVFSGLANIYSPYYRQMHFQGYKDNINGLKAFDFAYQDVENAFKHYLKNFNNGNRIVLAGHSQGTHHLQKLLNEYILLNDSILKKIELCYFVGDVFIENFATDGYPICESPTDLNCYLSWNSFPYGTSYPHKKNDFVSTTNPITWRNNEAASLYNMHKGILFNNYKIMRGGNKLKQEKILSAKVDNGLLWVEIENFPLFSLYNKFLKGNYHALDYNLFWMNIRENFYLRMHKK